MQWKRSKINPWSVSPGSATSTTQETPKTPVHGGDLVWAAALAGCSAEELLDFSANINPLGPPETARAAITAHLDSLKAYPDPDYQQLRQALAQMHQLPPEWIIPGNGAAELLTWVAWSLSRLEATYLVTPAFGDYWRALRAFNVKVLECPLSAVSGRWSLAWNFGSQTLQKGLLLNNPHNPTGRLWIREEICSILDRFALVVVDEAFMDFLPPDQEQSLIPVVRDYPYLVIVRSLTKFYSLPGLRLGYAIAHPDWLQQWRAWRDPWPVNTLAAAAGVACVGDTQFQQQTWSWLPPTRYDLFGGLGSLPGLQPFPSAANFLLVESDYPSSQLQSALLLHYQLLIRDCLSFSELGDRYFRVAVRSAADNQRLLSSLADLLS
ncbi:MAG: threonine-phosphate decarboxylase [Hormoscilla sp. SP5CHS1]|nr:threonine-phosphate decarboxylase [Hormoscilla sp. SP12CHS1]MBC6452160.1 threonine-phosphate decarboxylase [Hormoscilla sp. SP5CHS1]